MSAFNINPQLTSIVQEIGPCEGGFIAEKLYPTVRVPSCKFGWVDWKCTNEYDVFDDKIGCYSAPNEIDGPQWTYKYDAVQQHYLSTRICELDLACHNSAGCNNPTFDIEAIQARALFDRLRVNREVRAINEAFDIEGYTANEIDVNDNVDGGVTDLAGVLSEEGGLEKLTNLIACSSYGYNCLVLSKKTANSLVHKAAFNNKNCCAPNFGLRQNLDNIAALIGVQEIIISDVTINTAVKGLPKKLEQLLGDQALLLRNANLPGTDCPNRVFGFTAQFRDTFATRYVDQCKGGRGSLYLKAGWDIKQVTADREMGHLLLNICG